MPLNANWSKVKDWKKLHDETDGYQVTEALVFLTMAIGISRIDEKNYLEFYRRLKFYEKLWGERPRPITLEDVHRRIGLFTNASKLTEKQFISQQGATLMRSLKDAEDYDEARIPRHLELIV